MTNGSFFIEARSRPVWLWTEKFATVYTSIFAKCSKQ